MPSTPPETPLDGYFNAKEINAGLPPHSTGISIYPDSPPITPERRLDETEVRMNDSSRSERTETEKQKETTVLPTHGRRAPSVAYAHHRRTSTATIVRLAAAKQGIVLTPSKVLSLFLIFFSAVYLASFLPGPLHSLLHRPKSASLKKMAAPTYYSPPSVSGTLNNKPRLRTMPIGETAQRRAWEDSFPHRIPPQQHVVPVRHDSENLARSYHGDLYRAHPELLISNTGTQARRRPLRFGKPATGEHGEIDRVNGVVSENAQRASRQDTAPAEHQGQMDRMKKMALAKQKTAKIGNSAPLDSSEVLADNERIHSDESGGSRRRIKKVKAETKERTVQRKVSKTKEAGKPRLGMKDRQVLDNENRQTDGARTVDEWAEMEAADVM